MGGSKQQTGRIVMTRQQEKILDTLVYFLKRYKKAVTASESATGFEDMVFEQMIDTIGELREENDRLNSYLKKCKSESRRFKSTVSNWYES